MVDEGVTLAIDADVPENALDSSAEAMAGCSVGVIEEV